jgi:hypothetical protein
VKWVGRYIDEDPVVLASQGLSIAGAAAAKLRRALSEASKKKEKERSEKDKMRRGGKLYRVFLLEKDFKRTRLEAKRQEKQNPKIGQGKSISHQ